MMRLAVAVTVLAAAAACGRPDQPAQEGQGQMQDTTHMMGDTVPPMTDTMAGDTAQQM
jgi:hypothetical protein